MLEHFFQMHISTISAGVIFVLGEILKVEVGM